MALKYHQKTFDLLHEEPPKIAREKIKLLMNRQAACGVKFPESVMEWYSMGSSLEILKKYSRADDPYHPGQFGKVMKDWYGGGERDFAKEGLLLILSENQGVCQWAVKLDGSDDPPVVIEVDTAPNDQWLTYVDSFSDFVYTQVWDNCGKDYRYYFNAIDDQLKPDEVIYLQSCYKENIRTYGWPGDVNYRFYNDDVRILVWNSESHGQADWFIFTKSEAATVDLMKRLYSISDLKHTLESWEKDDLDVLNQAKTQMKAATSRERDGK
jgi:hypothetical protein